MCEFLEDLEPYIDDRIHSNFQKLKKSKEYRSKNNDYSKKFQYLFNKLNADDRVILEDSYGLLNELNSKEIYLAYQIGFVDGIKLDDYVEQNRS